MPADIFIAAAAVADWRVEGAGASKLKKGSGAGPTFKLVENPDILAKIASLSAGRPALVVGFAAETDHLLDNARAKLARKRCDLIVANDVSAGTGVMGGVSNTVHLVSRDGVESWPLLDKDEVARRLVSKCAELLAEKTS
jgi:phosphopantothenoylcysteine decarboxylase/phosphopantothenate--cysteine ligase